MIAWIVQAMVSGKGAQQSGGERCVDALEELEEDKAHGIAAGRQSVSAGMRQFVDQVLGSEFGEVVA